MAEPQNTPFGQGALQAAFRVGFKELAQILPAFPESVRPVEEPGLPFNLTPQEVVEQKHGRDHEIEMEM